MELYYVYLFNSFFLLFWTCRPYLDQYVRASNRLAFGERTVIVMSSKVAQKSYGTEKRCVALALRRSAAAGPIAS